VNLPAPTASEDEIRLERLRQRRRRYPLWRLTLANLRDLRLLVRQAWITLISLTTVIVGSVIYLVLIYYPQLCTAGATVYCASDVGLAIYQTLRMMVFEADLEFPNDWIGRTLFFALPLLGLFFLLSSVVNFTRLLFDKGSRPQAWQISLAQTFRDHMIVVGLGRVGYRVVLQLLDAGYEVVVVDSAWDSEFVPTILRVKVPMVHGDGRDPDVLRMAGLSRARGLITAINDDLQNIEIALTARRLRAGLATVMRIYNRALDVNLERSFGRNSAFSSSALAAPTFAAAAVSREIVHVLALPKALLGLTEVIIAPESELNGFVRAVEERYNVRVVRHRDAQGKPRRERGMLRRLEAGDVVLFLGVLHNLETVRMANSAGSKLRFLETVPQQRPNERLNRVIVCGLGKVGTEVLRLLMQHQPQPDLVVICTPETPIAATEPFSAAGVQVIRGDARDLQILHAAGIERTYAVAALFSDDLTNLQIGLAAREARLDVHLVLRVFSDVLAERLAAIFGINTAYSTSALAAPTLAAAAVLREVDHAFDVGERLFATETRTLQVGDGLAGRTVSALREAYGLLPIALYRADIPTILPSLDAELAPGDVVDLLGDVRDLARLR
jgi:Trk K+ transport system NAD-binding subunit